MDSVWKIGDVVQLNSGGPAMTIDSVQEDWVNCSWFVGKDLKTGTFNPASVRKYERPPAAVVVHTTR